MKKLLKIIGVILILFVAALIVVPMIFKDDIIQLVKDETNNAVNAKIDFGDFELSLIKSFPNFYFSIEDISVTGIDNFEGIELATLKQLSLEVDLMSVINGESIQVNEIRIVEPSIHAKVLSNGDANYLIAKEDSSVVTEVVEVETTSEGGSFKLALKQLEIIDATIVYDDATMPVHMVIQKFNLNLKGDFTENITNLETKASIETLNVDFDGITYMKNVSILLDAIVKVNLEESKYTFEENELRINELPLGFDGWLAMPNDPIEMDLTFYAKETKFKEILSLIPAAFASDLEGVETKGTIALSGYAKGTYLDSIYPAFGLKMQVDNGMFKYPDLPKSITDIQIKASIESKDGDLNSTIVDVPTFHLKMADNPFDLNFYLATPITDPFIRAGLKGKLILDNLKDIVPLEKGDELSGTFTADVSVEGKLSTLEQERYEEFKAAGTLLVEGIHFASDSLDYPIDLSRANMIFTPKYIELSEMNIKLGKSDISAQGSLENFIAYALKDKETLSGNLNIQSNLLDLNELSGVESNEDSEVVEEVEGNADSSNVEEPMEAVLIPKYIDFVMKATIKKLVYDDILIDDINGKIILKNEKIEMKNTNMKLIGGSMAMNGYYETTDSLKPTYNFDMNIKDFDLEQTIKTFNTVEQLAPIAKNSKGAYSTILSIVGDLDSQMEPIMNSINGNGSLRTQNVSIKDYKPFKKISELIKYDKLNPLNLDDVNISFAISDGKVFVKPFTTNIGDAKVTIEGSNSFDQTIDYVFSFEIPREEFGSDANKAIEGLLGQASAKGVDIKLPDVINIDVGMIGPASNPKITTSFRNVKSNAKDAIKDKVSEELDKKKKELEEQAKQEIEKQKEALEKQKKELEAKAKKEIEKQKKKAEEDARKEADKAMKKLQEEAKDKLKGLFK